MGNRDIDIKSIKIDLMKYINETDRALYVSEGFNFINDIRYDLSQIDIFKAIYKAYAGLIRYKGKHTEEEKEAIGVVINAFQEADVINNIHREELTKNIFRNTRIFKHDYFKEIKYFNNIKFDSTHVIGDYKLCNEEYMPGECIVYGIGQYGTMGVNDAVNCGVFFDKVTIPALINKDKTYMSITPNEIETMRDSIAAAHGKVLNYGLGLGYWAYEVASKSNVESVTIVELNQDVIDLFNTYIAPQFEPEILSKINIIQGDAIAYHRNLVDGVYDYCFIDTWFNAYEGMDMYLNFKEQEHKFKNMQVSYWVEADFTSVLQSLFVMANLKWILEHGHLSFNEKIIINEFITTLYSLHILYNTNIVSKINTYLYSILSYKNCNKLYRQLFNLENISKLLVEVLKDGI